ncbi:MAG TPA: hypothetical protein DEF45_04560 [Rhodopirellula sp.]|nr:hypothetical protein [Rhodopirellula sp.]
MLAMFREAMKGKPGPKPEGSSNDNIMGIEASQGTSRAYSVTRVQQECKPEVVQSTVQLFLVIAFQSPPHLSAREPVRLRE